MLWISILTPSGGASRKNFVFRACSTGIKRYTTARRKSGGFGISQPDILPGALTVDIGARFTVLFRFPPNGAGLRSRFRARYGSTEVNAAQAPGCLFLSVAIQGDGYSNVAHGLWNG